MRPELRVKKWGGENAAELTRSPQNIVLDFQNGVKQVVVVSPIRSPEFNTTDHLIKIGKVLSQNPSFEAVQVFIDELKEFHFTIVDEKIAGETSEIKSYINEAFLHCTKNIQGYLQSPWNVVPSKENDYSINTELWLFSIVWFWEVLSAYIQEKVINNLWIEWLKAEFVDLTGIVGNHNKNLPEIELFTSLSAEFSQRVWKVIDAWKVPIIPGYIPWFENGIENAIGRGYSDATASMTAVGTSKMYEVTLEIQKSVLWMLSSDPRVVKWGTKLIPQIDYLTAKEITGTRGAQAKLLHHQVLRRELQEAEIKVRLFDPFSESRGTLITKAKDQMASGVEFIGGRKNVVFFSVSSGKMQWEWILSDIFKIVKNYASVDIISTSETEISFTIESWLSPEKLEEMATKIRVALALVEDGYENSVTYETDRALVFCIGQNISNRVGILAKSANALADAGINIEMVSQGMLQRAIVFWVDAKEMDMAVNVLHEALI